MSQEQRTTKNIFRLNGGLNTEINELNFPDGYTRDEANYELLVDGSRRRRKGLAEESGTTAALSVGSWRTAEANQTYVWRNAGGDPNKKLVVYRKGDTLYFADADETVSDGWYSAGAGSAVSLSAYYASGKTDANTLDVPVTFSQGRGYLFVSGPYVKPFFVTYDSTADSFSSTSIDLRVRDFADIEDTNSVASEPATLTPDHRYNLRNRGWKEDEMAAYNSAKSKYPAKNALWWRGYKRVYDGSTAASLINPQDGQRTWDSNKLEAEAFGSSSAPKGSLFIEPFDTTFGYGTGNSNTELVDISSFSVNDMGTYWEVTITTSASHGIAVGEDFTIDNNSIIYERPIKVGSPILIEVTTTLDGTHEAQTGTTGSTLVFNWLNEPVLFTDWVDQYASKGTVDGSQSIARSIGAVHDDSFNAIEFHAGRTFYGGMKNSEWADTIMFSQIADSKEKFGRCYQAADPTDEDINALTSADGGTIIIEGLGGVLNLVSVRNSLIVIGRDGVWEISGGQRGVFTADGYSVRKLSSQGGSSPDGWVKLEDYLMYTGPGGIFMVAPNQYTGQLEVTSVIEQTIQTLWNELDDAVQSNCQLSYDANKKRVYILLGPDGSTTMAVDTILIFDAKVGGWFKYTFDTPTNNVLLTGFELPNVDDSSENKKMKFIYQSTSTTVEVADFDQTSFDDWDGTNGPLPFLLTGHDSIGDFQRRKQAPVITVYSKRTETGYTAAGTGWDPINPSSTLMKAYWDWTDDTVSNKVGTQREVYRDTRQFVPTSGSDVNGYPVVVTRNKVRGRGRALQLRFDGAADKDSHILGFTTNYKVSRRI